MHRNAQTLNFLNYTLHDHCFSVVKSICCMRLFTTVSLQLRGMENYLHYTEYMGYPLFTGLIEEHGDTTGSCESVHNTVGV